MTGQDEWEVGQFAEIDWLSSEQPELGTKAIYCSLGMRRYWRALNPSLDEIEPSQVTAVRPLRLVPSGAAPLAGLPTEDPSALSDPEMSEGERVAFLRSGLPRDGLAGSDEAVEAAARAMAVVNEENGCFERVDEYEAITDPLEREDFDRVHGKPHDDFEDCEYWRLRAKAAFGVIAAHVRAEAVAEHRADLQHRIEVSTRYENDRRVALAERDEYHRHWQDAEKRTATVVAEAVAEERQRVAQVISAAVVPGDPDGLFANKEGWNRALECMLRDLHAAAGSVPVATPDYFVVIRHPDGSLTTAPGPVATPVEPVTGLVGPDGTAYTKAELAELFPVRVPLATTIKPSVATPAEMDGQCAHCTVSGDDVYPCNQPASAEALTSVGYWKLVCDEHAKRYPNLRPRTPVVVAEPSVGTGTPGEAVSGDSGHTERQGPTVSGELAVIQQTLLEVKGWSQGRGRPAALLAAMLTALDAVDRLARTDLGEVGRLTAEVARLRGDRNQALQRELEAVCRCIEVTADVARYQAAIGAIKELHVDNGHGWCQGCAMHPEHGCWLVRTDECRNRIALAAALGDGE